MQDPAHAAPYSDYEERVHTLMHGAGLGLSLVGGVWLVALASKRDDTGLVIGCAVFGVSLILLYGASTFYHGLRRGRAKRFLQKLDHASIFLLIAGTYTPVALVSLRGSTGEILLVTIWSLAIIGIGLQVMLPAYAKHISVPLYLGMGWIAVIVLDPLEQAISPGGIALLVAGGLAYTVGVVFYAWRSLPFNHAVWHGFVLVGSGCHFWCVLAYVIPAAAA